VFSNIAIGGGGGIHIDINKVTTYMSQQISDIPVISYTITHVIHAI
jgi:hypothetical protein